MSESLQSFCTSICNCLLQHPFMQINDLEKDNTRKTKKYICGLGSRKIKQMLSLKTHYQIDAYF